MNINVEFQGHVCEVQIQLKAFFDLKKLAHKSYAVVRSLQIEGELTEIPEDTAIPLWVRIACILLHASVVVIGIRLSTLYRFYHWTGFFPTILPIIRLLYNP